MTRFADKVAIITGSSNGIGRSTAVLLAKDGAKVTITGRNAERLEETRQDILKAGVPAENVHSVVGNLTAESVQDEIISSTIKKFGKLNILINNAGANIPDSAGATGIHQNLVTFDKIIDLNLKCVISMIRKTRPHLAATKGEIVNVSSIGAGPQSYYGSTYYSIAKSALDQLTRNVAIGLIPEGIRVNSVSPGFVATGFKEAQGMAGDSSEKFYRYMGAHTDCIPVGFVGQPKHIADTIAFLADRNLSSYIIGQSIVADGGSSLVTTISQHSMEEILAS